MSNKDGLDNDTVEFDAAINSSNDAFGNDPIVAAKETARILREMADDIEYGTVHCSRSLRDGNGNTVGSFTYNFTADDDD